MRGSNKTHIINEIIQSLADAKALEGKIIDVGSHCSYTDHFIVVSATSSTHAQSIADGLIKLQKKHIQPEGYQAGQWILVDMGDVIVHIFQQATREFYHLDKLWAHAPSQELALEGIETPELRQAQSV